MRDQQSSPDGMDTDERTCNSLESFSGGNPRDECAMATVRPYSMVYISRKQPDELPSTDVLATIHPHPMVQAARKEATGRAPQHTCASNDTSCTPWYTSKGKRGASQGETHRTKRPGCSSYDKQKGPAISPHW